jgi:hypothetical protein
MYVRERPDVQVHALQHAGDFRHGDADDRTCVPPSAPTKTPSNTAVIVKMIFLRGSFLISIIHTLSIR